MPGTNFCDFTLVIFYFFPVFKLLRDGRRAVREMDDALKVLKKMGFVKYFGGGFYFFFPLLFVSCGDGIRGSCFDLDRLERSDVLEIKIFVYYLKKI